MKQRTSFLLHTAAFSIAVLALSTSAWAQVTGTVWQVPGNDENVTTTAPTSGLLGTFNSNEINFSITPAQNEASQSLTTNEVLYGFLTGNGATITTSISGANLAAIMTGSTVGASQSLSGTGGVNEGAGGQWQSTSSAFDTSVSPGCYDNTENTGNGSGTATGCYSEIIEITGTATFVSGQTYGVTHDDGVIMTINSGTDAGTVINSAAPTGAITNNFTTMGATQTDSFTIWYEATNGNPSVLEANFGAAASTPEPGSVSLLFTMLGGIAGLAFILKKKLA